MKPVTFKGMNCTFAKDQPEYLPLPAHKTDDGMVTTLWKAGLLERLKVLLTGKIIVVVMTFNAPLQPLKITT